MKTSGKIAIVSLVTILLTIGLYSSCGGSSSSEENNNNSNSDNTIPLTSDSKIIFLHHSTGGVIWDGGVSDWISDYNSANSKTYSITETNFPSTSGGYPWENYPYDYWNIWINHAGESEYMDEPTLEILTKTYNVIIWKHCFPVSNIVADAGSASVSSSTKMIQNYKLQYEALKTKMHEYPNVRFIVWTGAANVASATNAAEALRAREFFTWVKDTWDETGDNIFIWDFFALETEGTNYLKDASSAGPGDSHPSATFATTVAPYFGQRIVDVIEGRGDSGSLTGH